MLTDYYAILRVDSFASTEEIKKSYRRLSRELHPDLHGNSKEANERFKKINEAYEILSNPEKRDRYDLSYYLNLNPFFGFQIYMFKLWTNRLRKRINPNSKMPSSLDQIL